MKKNTVFVIGAGASKEAHLPTGKELKSDISMLLDIRFDEFGHRLESGDYKVMEALRLYVKRSDGNRGNINHFMWKVRYCSFNLTG